MAEKKLHRNKIQRFPPDSQAVNESQNNNAVKIQICVPSDHEHIRINKWRVRQGAPLNAGQIVMLYQNVDADGQPTDKIVHKLKVQSDEVGMVKKCLHKEGAIVNKLTPLLEVSECVHTTVMKDMCADCGADLRINEKGNTSEASVPMVHSIPDLKVTQKLAQKLGHDDTRRLLQDRKLVLLVDLDQTVIHTTNDNVPNNIKGIHHFQLYGPHSPWYHTRLRPHTLEFLENISKFYELHICTFGARNYAHMIAQIIDPDGKYFSHRILSRDECFNATSKIDNLKALFPNGDSMVCIIDDREDVWNMASNLIQVRPYHFFQHTGDINAPPGHSKHELDGEGVDFKSLAKKAKKSKKEDELKKSEEIDDKASNVQTDSTAEVESKDCTDETNDKSKDTLAKEETLNKVPETDKTSIDNEASTSATPSPPSEASSIKVPEAVESIEIDDRDDYLLHLQVILKNVHDRFYSIYDKTSEIADMKIIVPKIRAEVLRGLSLVFSGLVPNNMKLEQTRAYFIAKSLGADVKANIVAESTHMVAATAGTYKVMAAKKKPSMHIVNVNWLWSCAERWEHVDEKVFPLDPKGKTHPRQPPLHCHSPEHVVDYNETSEISDASIALGMQAKSEPEKFIDTINPLLSFSNADLADMNEEFDQFFESDSSSDNEVNHIESPPLNKNLKRRKQEEKEEDRYKNFFTRPESENNLQSDSNHGSNKSSLDQDEDDDDTIASKFRRGEALPSDVGLSSDSESDGVDEGDWNMMGAALEREFLGNDEI